MIRRSTSELEERRVLLQEKLDARKTRTERNRMGQFATPTRLATDILGYAEGLLCKSKKVRFIDPAMGTGSFYSALLEVFPKSRIDAAAGYEIDEHYGIPALRLWEGTGLEVRLEDFTEAVAPPEPQRFNLLVCNPPYVRHHHIGSGEKPRLRVRAQSACGVGINGLAGLYCYFLGLSHAWMTSGGLAGWLIPSEFMDVNYGRSVKRYLLDKVRLLHVHRFDPNDIQFGDALVSSAIVWFRKEAPEPEQAVRFTYGGSLNKPKVERLVAVEELRREPKWTRYPIKEGLDRCDTTPVLGDFFRIKRGLVTGDNSYFILTAEEIERRELPHEAFRPILPSPRYLPEDEVASDGAGNPVLDRRLFLLDCRLGEVEIGRRYPALWRYLEEGKARDIAKRYLCRHRKPWYAQEQRPPALFVCTYLGRSNGKNGRPFRFILNHSRATAANVYLMLYPRERVGRILEQRPELKKRIWQLLNEICPSAMLGEGRVYGGGLHKLEPKELGNVRAARLARLVGAPAKQGADRQPDLFEPKSHPG